MTRTQEFYEWWTKKVKGDYISDSALDKIINKNTMFQITFSISHGGGNIKVKNKVFSNEQDYENFIEYYQRNHKYGKIIGQTERILINV